MRVETRPGTEGRGEGGNGWYGSSDPKEKKVTRGKVMEGPRLVCLSDSKGLNFVRIVRKRPSFTVEDSGCVGWRVSPDSLGLGSPR